MGIVPCFIRFTQHIWFELLLTGGAAPASNWGDGFASQPEVLALFPTCGISNPGPVFFQPLLSKPYLSQVDALLEPATGVLTKAPESTGALEMNVCMQLEPNSACYIYVLHPVSHRTQVCCGLCSGHHAASEACINNLLLLQHGTCNLGCARFQL